MKRFASVAGVVALIVGLAGVSSSAIELNFLGSFDAPGEGWAFEGVRVGGISGLSCASDGTFV